MDVWLKDVAPSDALRRWFGHDPAKWAEFRDRYFAELEAAPEAIQPIVEAALHGDVTLLYSVTTRSVTTLPRSKSICRNAGMQSLD